MDQEARIAQLEAQVALLEAKIAYIGVVVDQFAAKTSANAEAAAAMDRDIGALQQAVSA